MIEPYFEPYEGKKYRNSDPRILVIGDSHYCGGCELCGVRGHCAKKEMKKCRSITQKSVCDYLSYRKGERDEDGWMRTTYLSFDKIFYGKKDISASESIELWDRIVFYNFVQTAASKEKSNAKYSTKEYNNSNPMAWNVIYKSKPNLIIIWGSRAYNSLNVLKDESWNKINDFSGYFTLSDGSNIYCIKIWHPSRANKEKWHKKLIDFIHFTNGKKLL